MKHKRGDRVLTNSGKKIWAVVLWTIISLVISGFASLNYGLMFCWGFYISISTTFFLVVVGLGIDIDDHVDIDHLSVIQLTGRLIALPFMFAWLGILRLTDEMYKTVD